jgi:hypothetical protein
MQTFVSSALGEPHQYRSWFSDQVGLVLLARSPAQVGGDLLCRPKGDPGDYKQVFHTHPEVIQVKVLHRAPERRMIAKGLPQ